MNFFFGLEEDDFEFRAFKTAPCLLLFFFTTIIFNNSRWLGVISLHTVTLLYAELRFD